MNNKLLNKFLYVAVCLALPMFAYGQTKRFDPALNYNDIAFSAGIYHNAKTGLLSDGTVYTVDFGNFIYNGIGFRGGLNYIDALDNNVNVVSLPLSFAWRTPARKERTVGEHINYGLKSYLEEMSFSAAVLSMLLSRLEFNAGLTPGYVAGDDSYGQRWNNSIGNYMDGVSVDRRFMLSADVGFRVSVRVWRFNLVISPQYHYWLTDNFSRRSSIESLDGQKLSRSYASLNFGLAFMF